MSDEGKPFSRPKGPKAPRGGKPEGREKRAGKPAFGGKPSRPAAKGAWRGDDRKAEARGERPPRDFSKPRRESRPERPAGSSAPRPGRRPFEKREASADTSPPREFKREDRPRDGGNKRPGRFERAGRDNRKTEAGGDRPQRDFSKPRREGRENGNQAATPRRPTSPLWGGRAEGAGGGEKNRQRTSRTPAPALRADPPHKREGEESGERIAKRLARAGISSRRDAEELIAAGRVKVNGKVLTSPAFNVRHSDVIELDNAEIPAIERTRLFLFHKPGGVVTTNRDPQGRKTVFDILPKDLPRLMTVGRLDINTEGLLLLTNDGGLSRVLELPSTGWLRRYRVRVRGKVDATALEGLKDGIAVDGVFYGAIEATLDREQGSNAWLTLGLREGKNREVKNILGALGLEVSRLIRISYGPFQLGELAEGAVQELKGKTLRDQLGQRLVEESGANFSAAVATPFSNQPVRRERDESPEAAERPKPRRDGERGRIGEGGLVKNRKREREEKRENALGRLQTTRPERLKNFKQERGGRPGEREKKREEPPRSRSSNVWMAPGARPSGKKDATSPSPRPRGGKGPPSLRKLGPGKGPRNR